MTIEEKSFIEAELEKFRTQKKTEEGRKDGDEPSKKGDVNVEGDKIKEVNADSEAADDNEAADSELGNSSLEPSQIVQS